MNLADYVREVGAEKVAEQFGVTTRAAFSWQYGTRRPRAEVAKRIVAETPVTWAGIYGFEPTSPKHRERRPQI